MGEGDWQETFVEKPCVSTMQPRFSENVKVLGIEPRAWHTLDKHSVARTS